MTTSPTVDSATRFVVRHARPDELDALADDLARAYRDNLLAIPLPPDEAEATADFGMRQMIRQSPPSEHLAILVLEDTEQGRLAAAFLLMFLPAMKAAHGVYVWVREEYRGLGLARTMFAHAEALARERGAVRLEAGVLKSNDRAFQFYLRIGFVPFGYLIAKRL